MPNELLAYHITFATYGTRLHGDERGTVDRQHHTPGEPLLPPNEPRERFERRLMKFPPVQLTAEQRAFVETSVVQVCQRGGWTYHINSCAADHVHTLLTADPHGNRVRRWLKTWLGDMLSTQWTLPAGGRWWADGGSVKWVWDQTYFDTIFEYIRLQRASPSAPTSSYVFQSRSEPPAEQTRPPQAESPLSSEPLHPSEPLRLSEPPSVKAAKTRSPTRAPLPPYVHRRHRLKS